MRIWVFFMACAGSLWLAGCSPSETGRPVADAVRLHVIAHSDDPSDQELKRAVRDALLGSLAAGWSDAQSCYDDLCARSAELDALADEIVSGEGFDYGARVETGIFSFPTRVYGDTAWPAGYYRAVRVILGAGGGHNWWCVIFPQLCLAELPGTQDVDAETGAAPAIRERGGVIRAPAPAITEPVRIRSWIWERWAARSRKESLPVWFGWEYDAKNDMTEDD